MPNWCNNNVSISHPDREKMEALAEAVREGKFCNHVIPVPESLHIVAGRVGDDTDPKQIELEAAEKRNLEAHGYATWYDFCVNRWGTKWDIDAYDPEDVKVDDNNTIYFGFDSAWAPPVGVYEELVDQGYTVLAQYYEPGCAFVGEFDDGYDNCIDISGMRSDEVREAIGEFLDDNFGISECMKEYEDSEKDEVEIWYEDGVEKKGLEPHK